MQTPRGSHNIGIPIKLAHRDSRQKSVIANAFGGSAARAADSSDPSSLTSWGRPAFLASKYSAFFASMASHACFKML